MGKNSHLNLDTSSVLKTKSKIQQSKRCLCNNPLGEAFVNVDTMTSLANRMGAARWDYYSLEHQHEAVEFYVVIQTRKIGRVTKL